MSAESRRGPRARIGDRLEHAIGEHADVEHEIERGEAEQPPRRRLRHTIVWLAITGVSLYPVAPTLFDVLGASEDLAQINPAWLPAMAALQGAAIACLWALQHVALHAHGWRAVIGSQLAGNALSKVAPGGGAAGAGVPRAAQVLAQVPFTPGRLGFVEAGLTATLTLAGVSAGDAVLATLAYRLFSYWLPLPLGLAGLVVHRRSRPQEAGVG